MNIDEIPLHPKAESKKMDGSYEVSLDTQTNQILRTLKEKYGTVKDKIVFLSNDVTWQEVSTFYEKNFSDRGFTRDNSVVETHKHYKLAQWNNDGWFDKKGVGVAMIEVDSLKFLAIYSFD